MNGVSKGGRGEVIGFATDCSTRRLIHLRPLLRLDYATRGVDYTCFRETSTEYSGSTCAPGNAGDVRKRTVL